jgi:hypothetical protein
MLAGPMAKRCCSRGDTSTPTAAFKATEPGRLAGADGPEKLDRVRPPLANNCSLTLRKLLAKLSDVPSLSVN